MKRFRSLNHRDIWLFLSVSILMLSLFACKKRKSSIPVIEPRPSSGAQADTETSREENNTYFQAVKKAGVCFQMSHKFYKIADEKTQSAFEKGRCPESMSVEAGTLKSFGSCENDKGLTLFLFEKIFDEAKSEFIDMNDEEAKKACRAIEAEFS